MDDMKTVEVRKPGRPRSEDADRAIVTATLDLLVESGVAGLSIEQVAAAAGVGKATVYRRWRSKEDLVVHALASIEEPIPRVSGTSVRDDLVTLVDHIRRRHDDTQAGRLLACISQEGERHPELRRRYFETVIEPRREAVRAVIARGVATGELRDDLELDLAMLLLSGPMLAAVKLIPHSDPVPKTLAADIVDAVLDGLRKR